MSESTLEVPWEREAVLAVTEPHLKRFGEVLEQAWGAYATIRQRSRSQMARAGASSRGMLVSDLTRQPAHPVFAGIDGVRVEDRFGRAWVNLEGGQVQVRFRKLDNALQLCRSDSDRATRLAFHLGDTLFPELPPATVLTAGYVLDAAELAIERIELVCHVGTHVHYAIPLPGRAQTVPAPTQLSLAPLSAPIIRSAREAVVQRLAAKEGPGA